MPEQKDSSLPDLVEEAEKSVAYISCHSGDMYSAGSSFFIDAEGMLVTNAHVIDDSTTVAITLHDGTVCKGIVCYSDRRRDIAFISSAVEKTVPLEPTTADLLKKGIEVFTLGYPNRDKCCTVTRGVISASKINVEGHYYVQTDAAINRGNSGGPLLDSNGNFVGMCSGSQVDADGIAFAIPAESILKTYKSFKAASEQYDSDTAECPHCYFENPVLDKYCNNCGAKLVWFSLVSKANAAKRTKPNSPMSAPSQEPASGEKCQSCGAINQPDNAYCMNCGVGLHKEDES